MEYRRLGTSDLEASAVVFGAWAAGGWLWGGTDDELAIAAIRKGIDVGITTIDTAPMYGFGHSERVVGEAIKERRDEVIVATKCCLVWDHQSNGASFDTEDADGNPRRVYRDLGADSILRECDQSLERLGVDCIDLYQCHWPDEATPLKETMGALVRLLDQGKIRAIGLSNFTPALIEECRQYGPVHCVQPPYSMLNRGAEADVLPYCAANDVGTIVYSPLQQGMLTGKVTLEREFPEGDMRRAKPWFQPQNRRRALELLEKLQPIADAHGKTLAQLAINWCLCREGITCAIVGARRPEQADENAGGAGWSLTGEEVAQIERWLEDLGAPV